MPPAGPPRLVWEHSGTDAAREESLGSKHNVSGCYCCYIKKSLIYVVPQAVVRLHFLFKRLRINIYWYIYF